MEAAYALGKAFTSVHEMMILEMHVYAAKGRHRRPKRRFTRALAAMLLVVLLTDAPATATIAPPADRPAAYTAEER